MSRASKKKSNNLSFSSTTKEKNTSPHIRIYSYFPYLSNFSECQRNKGILQNVPFNYQTTLRFSGISNHSNLLNLSTLKLSTLLIISQFNSEGIFFLKCFSWKKFRYSTPFVDVWIFHLKRIYYLLNS